MRAIAWQTPALLAGLATALLALAAVKSAGGRRAAAPSVLEGVGAGEGPSGALKLKRWRVRGREHSLVYTVSRGEGSEIPEGVGYYDPEPEDGSKPPALGPAREERRKEVDNAIPEGIGYYTKEPIREGWNPQKVYKPKSVRVAREEKRVEDGNNIPEGLGYYVDEPKKWRAPAKKYGLQPAGDIERTVMRQPGDGIPLGIGYFKGERASGSRTYGLQPTGAVETERGRERGDAIPPGLGYYANERSMRPPPRPLKGRYDYHDDGGVVDGVNRQGKGNAIPAGIGYYDDEKPPAAGGGMPKHQTAHPGAAASAAGRGGGGARTRMEPWEEGDVIPEGLGFYAPSNDAYDQKDYFRDGKYMSWVNRLAHPWPKASFSSASEPKFQSSFDREKAEA